MTSAMLTITGQSRQLANDTVKTVSVDAYVYGPSTPGDYPVIVYSHGTFGFADQSNPNFTTSLPLYWASQGYIVIVPGHADGQDATASQSGLPRFDDSVGVTDGFLFNRVADMKMALDHATDLAAALGPGYGVTGDFVAAGYSAGGGAAQVAAGASIKDLTGTVVNWGDARFDAVIDLSAGGVPIYGFYADGSGNSWQGLNKPLFVAAGEKDTQKGGANYQYKLDPYDYAPAGDKYAFVFNDANHGTSASRPRTTPTSSTNWRSSPQNSSTHTQRATPPTWPISRTSTPRWRTTPPSASFGRPCIQGRPPGSPPPEPSPRTT